MEKEHAEFLLYHRLYDAVKAWELDVYGEMLKEKNNWKAKTGREAIALYLVNKRGWTFEHCASLSDEVLQLILADELKSWRMPGELESLCGPVLKFLKERPAV